MLATTPIVGYAAGEPTELYKPKIARPTLEYDTSKSTTDFGELVHVRWNNHDRAALRVVPGHLTAAWYDAARRWNELLTSKELEYWVQLKPGTVLLMDNHRVLHGRSAFEGKRRMCGAYVGWDEYRSRFEVLQEKFGNAAGENVGVWDKRF
jgi:trimethyllysine dioxygenase